MREKPIVEFSVQSSLVSLDELVAGARAGVRMTPEALAVALGLVRDTLDHVAPVLDPCEEPELLAHDALSSAVMLLLKRVGYAAFVEGIVSEGSNTEAHRLAEVATRAVMVSARNALLAAGTDAPLGPALATVTAASRQGEPPVSEAPGPVPSATEGLFRATDFAEKQVRVERLLRARFSRWGWPGMGGCSMAQFVDDIIDEVEPPFPLTDPGDGCTPTDAYQVRELLRLKDAEIARLEARVEALSAQPDWTQPGTTGSSELRYVVLTQLQGRLVKPNVSHEAIIDNLISAIKRFAIDQSARGVRKI